MYCSGCRTYIPIRSGQSYKNRLGFDALYECLFQVIYFKAAEEFVSGCSAKKEEYTLFPPAFRQHSRGMAAGVLPLI